MPSYPRWLAIKKLLFPKTFGRSLWTKPRPCPDIEIIAGTSKPPRHRQKPPKDSVPRKRYRGRCIVDREHGILAIGTRTSAKYVPWNATCSDKR